ncbi:signal peptide peptidase SppA [Devosia lucknowensis]|uniref:Signal peptide peptidase SppA n=1 Tax=Devosia lucknowensis TaxID=1096929 RepID=A0A1Y6EUD1_9HYPH|nr:S49 family peptidase [Devosia lucknowensis]SMQ65906.1 signal peptide peptidase SppA [Devosia lucknowensis]
MKYQHILSAFAAEPWAMDRGKLAVITDFLAFKAAGGEVAADEMAARISKKQSGEIARREGAVAIIPVHGVLAAKMDLMTEISGGMSYTGLQKALHAAIDDPEVKAIVLDIDSPGGAVPGAQELGDEIRALRGGDKPIIAQVNHLAASAAYWIASQADEVVVSPSGRAGSIGVYTVHEDISAALEKAGVKRTYIAAGDHKVEGNETEPLSEDALSFVQERVRRSYDRFVGAVSAGRGVSVATVEKDFGQGRVFFAEELIEKGMADSIATLDETLARFGADQTPETVRKLRSENSARAEDAEHLLSTMKVGGEVTKREFENGLKGLGAFTNSEAERAARLYFKNGQGDPDEGDAALMAKVEEALAIARTITV